MASSDTAPIVLLEIVYWSGVAAVVVGVILEGAEVWHRRRSARRLKRLQFTSPWNPWQSNADAHEPSWVHNWGDLGWFILVVGLVAESVASFQIDRIKTEELRALTTELINIKAPRTITKEQRKVFIEFSKKLPKGKIKIGVRNPDVETVNYVEEVVGMIREAGYEIQSNLDYPSQIFSVSNTNNASLIMVWASNTNVPLQMSIIFAFNEAGINIVRGANDEFLNNRFAVSEGEVMIFITEKRHPFIQK